MTTYARAFAPPPNAGTTMGDDLSLFNAIVARNGMSRAYGISSTGNDQNSATQLTCVINEIEQGSGSQGVNLPSTTGGSNIPFKFCVVINNKPGGRNPLSVYGAKGTSDTINGTSVVIQAVNTVRLYVSSSPGKWFTVTS